MDNSRFDLSGPITEHEFDGIIRPFEPFEDDPIVGVGVSGGADSLCLLILLDAWLRRRGGRAVALIVDHRIRPETQQEVQQVKSWLSVYGIENHVLFWHDQKPKTGVQAAARNARYQLLTQWCWREGVLHLALAHHQNDQAETYLLRKDRGSGPNGLAAMPIVSERNNVRILRPFLSIPGQRLRSTLQCMQQQWIEDPSNKDPAYARTLVRERLNGSQEDDTVVDRISELASEYASWRCMADKATARFLALAARIDPAGFCLLEKETLKTTPKRIALRALAQLLLSMGGQQYSPKERSLFLLYESICGDRLAGGRTLAGCYITSHQGVLLICREPVAAQQRISLSAQRTADWDRRFHVCLAHKSPIKSRHYEVAQLGANGWHDVKRSLTSFHGRELPLFVKYTLPALWDLDGIVSVPHLDYQRHNSRRLEAFRFMAKFRPRRALAGPPFKGPFYPRRRQISPSDCKQIEVLYCESGLTQQLESVCSE